MLTAVLLAAALQSSPAAPEAAALRSDRVTRQDLAVLVQELDAALARPLIRGEVAGEELRAANARFDRISLRFFAGRPAAVRDELVAWLDELRPEGGRPPRPPRPRAPLSRVRRALEARLDAAEEAGADLHGPSLRVLRARMELLVDEPSTSSSREFLLATPALAREVAEEARLVLAGERPYARRTGDHWRTVAHGDRDLALRVHRPAAPAGGPMPLLVAFHGAGGDENFLFELAGDGHLKTLAERHGVLVVCPSTMDFLLDPAAFDALLAGIGRDHAHDPDRVLLFGHSLGTAAVARIVQERGERVAGAVCVAGFSGSTEGAPPVHVIAGEFDPIAPPARLRGVVETAAARGAEVTFEVLEDQGHTLLLPAALERTMGRLLGPR